MNPIELASIAAIVSALAGALVALRRFRPEKDSLVVTQAQGAATILNDLVRTLYAEIERERAGRQRDHERAEAEIRGLREELARCRELHGR